MPVRTKNKITQALQNANKPHNTPLWKGPEEDGITQTLLSKYLVCKERFRVQVIEGWRQKEGFSKSLEYGNMWHTCEEALLAGENWENDLYRYCKSLCERYTSDQEQIEHWYNVCKMQFPVYVEYWKKSDHIFKNKETWKQEENFAIPYELSDGRTVLLRGKWDGVFFSNVDGEKDRKVFLQENKTKGQISEGTLQSHLSSGFELQTMLYLIALREEIQSSEFDIELGGILYNVVRRPLSGGKGNIRPHKARGKKPAERMTDYYLRLQQVFKDDPDHFFMRWKVDITSEDLERFEKESLQPILKELCDDYTCWKEAYKVKADPFGTNGMSRHFRMPYGIYNPLAEGRSTELDDYLLSGNTVGLERATTLFGELE